MGVRCRRAERHDVIADNRPHPCGGPPLRARTSDQSYIEWNVVVGMETRGKSPVRDQGG